MGTTVATRTNSALPARAGRLVLATPVLAIVAVVPVSIKAWVDNYAVHFCRWPATISCSDPGDRWGLVPIWYALFGLLGAVALLAWAWTGRNGVWGWALVAWVIAFLPLTFASGPRVFGLADLLVVGAYTWFGLEFARRAALAWHPRLRTPVTALTVAITFAYVLTLATMPSYLAARAVA